MPLGLMQGSSPQILSRASASPALLPGWLLPPDNPVHSLSQPHGDTSLSQVGLLSPAPHWLFGLGVWGPNWTLHLWA